MGDATPWRPDRSALVLLLRACSLDSGLQESGLTELWAETSDETLARDLRSLLQDVDTLASECARLFSSARGHRRDQRMPVAQLYELTQRLIYCLGGRDEEVLAHIADVFTATSAGREAEGIGRVELQGHVASVLTQILRELEARPSAAAEADRHRLAYTFCDGFHDLCQEEDDPTWLPPPRKGPRPQPPSSPPEPEPRAAPQGHRAAPEEDAKPEEAPVSEEERQAILLAKMREPPPEPLKQLAPAAVEVVAEEVPGADAALPQPLTASHDREREATELDEQRMALKGMAAPDESSEVPPAAELDEQRMALRRMAALDNSLEGGGGPAPQGGGKPPDESVALTGGIPQTPPPLSPPDAPCLRVQEPLREPGGLPPSAREGPRARADPQDLNSPRPSLRSEVGCLSSVGGLSVQEPLREPRPQRPPRAGRSSLEWQERADLPDPTAPTPRHPPRAGGDNTLSYFIGNDDDDDGVPVEVATEPSRSPDTDEGDHEDSPAPPGGGHGSSVPNAPSKCPGAPAATGHWECAAPRLTEDGAWASPAAAAASAAQAAPSDAAAAGGSSWVRRVGGSFLRKLDRLVDSLDSAFSAAPPEDAPPPPPPPHGARGPASPAGVAEAQRAERRGAEEAFLAERQLAVARGGPAARSSAAAAAPPPVRPTAAACPGGSLAAVTAAPHRSAQGAAQYRDPPPNAGGHFPSPNSTAVYFSRGTGETAPHEHHAGSPAHAQSMARYAATDAQHRAPPYPVPQGAAHVPPQSAAAQVADVDMALQAEALLQEVGLPAYIVVKRDWTPRRLVLTRRYLCVNQEGPGANLKGAHFELDELNQVIQRCRRGQHCLSLQFKQGALLLRFNCAVHLGVLLRALLRGRRIPVIEAHD